MIEPRFEALLEAVETGQVEPVYLVVGDLVAAEPRAERLARAIAERAGCELRTVRRPVSLGPVLDDLKTFSLFDPAKVALVVDSAVLADARAAADLIDRAAEALPVESAKGSAEPAPLSAAQREAAARLLQALHLFGIDPFALSAEEALDGLPKFAFQGGTALRKKKPRGRSAKDVKTLRGGLPALLEAGIDAGLRGVADADVTVLGELVHGGGQGGERGGLPQGHCLVLVERSAAKDHPVVAALREAGAVTSVATVSAEKGGGWSGLEGLVAELELETGVGIEPRALTALAQRTLRAGSGGWKDKTADADTTARLAGEYRKLAHGVRSAGGRRIDSAAVEAVVEDRGEEDVWKILDAIGEGRGAEALGRYRRLIDTAEDPMRARLSFFSLLAGFCRQLAAVAGIARVAGVPAHVRNYSQFKSRWAPVLQGDVPGAAKSPLAGLHPFRLHRAYLAASTLDRDALARLPWRILETEMRIKGDASDADTAVADLLAHLVTARL